MAERLLLVGFGNMGQALVNGWLAHGRDARTISIVDPHPDAREAAAALDIAATSGWPESVRDHDAGPEVVLLAVKPARVDDVLHDYRALGERSLFLSVAAGKTIAGIAAVLGPEAAIVRAMPNTPAAIGRGVTVLCANDHVTADQRRVCTALMEAIGSVEWLDDERLMDVVTAVSGSGPAYALLLIECLTEAGRELGLDPEVAARLAVRTVAGTGLYAEQSDADAAELRRQVTSPGGTTEAALEQLMSDGQLADLMGRAVRAAAKRSRELSSE